MRSCERVGLVGSAPLSEGGTVKKYLWAPLLVLALSACGGPAKDATYENASKLREAVIASGVDCPGDAVKHDDKYGEDYVRCAAGLSLAVYAKDGDAAISKTVHEIQKDSYLMGTRWIIQGDAGTLGKLKDKLGGSLSLS